MSEYKGSHFTLSIVQTGGGVWIYRSQKRSRLLIMLHKCTLACILINSTVWYEWKKKALLLGATSLVYNPCTFVWRCIKKLCLLILFRGGVAQLLGAILGSGADLVFTLRLLFALLLCYLPLRHGQSLSVMPELLLTAPRKCTKERIGTGSLHWSYSKWILNMFPSPSCLGYQLMLDSFGDFTC